jgi:hypothetical protein
MKKSKRTLVRDKHEPSRPDNQPYAMEVEDYSGERRRRPVVKREGEQSKSADSKPDPKPR